MDSLDILLLAVHSLRRFGRVASRIGLPSTRAGKKWESTTLRIAELVTKSSVAFMRGSESIFFF